MQYYPYPEKDIRSRNNMEIENKIANSSLKIIDLEEYYPTEERVFFDLKGLLWQEQVLREAEFRDFLKNQDWSTYKNKYVAINCTADAIIPSWAFLLITTYLQPFAKKIIKGDLLLLEIFIYQEIIDQIPINTFENARLLIKGCSKIEIPDQAYIYLIQRMQPYAKSIMFGEACSTVPLFKQKV